EADVARMGGENAVDRAGNTATERTLIVAELDDGDGCGGRASLMPVGDILLPASQDHAVGPCGPWASRRPKRTHAKDGGSGHHDGTHANDDGGGVRQCRENPAH